MATVLPTFDPKQIQKASLHPALYVLSWIAFSSIVIIFNKYILDNAGFRYPAILTCWHLAFSALVTQILARTTTLLDGRKTVKMTSRVYLRAIMPIGVFFSLSLVCSNQTYLYLSVAFIQMLKASAPVAVLLASWLFRISTPKMDVLLNVLVIVFGVALASYGEITFVWIGFFYQAGGIVFEAIRLTMIQILLSGEGQNMDPLVSLYYYAPVCVVMNFLVAAATELSSFHRDDVWRVGPLVLLLNAVVVFFLNVSSVMLIGKTSGLVMTLCGVLKNILIVGASVMIWGTVISGFQFLGYGVALAGLVYYGVGSNCILAYYQYSQNYASKMWEGEGPTVASGRWALVRKTLAVVTCVTIVVSLVMGMAVWNRVESLEKVRIYRSGQK